MDNSGGMLSRVMDPRISVSPAFPNPSVALILMEYTPSLATDLKCPSPTYVPLPPEPFKGKLSASPFLFFLKHKLSMVKITICLKNYKLKFAVNVGVPCSWIPEMEKCSVQGVVWCIRRKRFFPQNKNTTTLKVKSM